MDSSANPTVIVVDDDPSIRQSLEDLLLSVNLAVKTMSALPNFVVSGRPEHPTCLVLDVRLPGQSGIDFQRELFSANIYIPIIFLTGHGDIPMCAKAMKEGAFEFFTKPFREQDLLDAVQLALAKDKAWLEGEVKLTNLRERYKLLSVREREVMAYVVTGLLNKQIAAKMGLSEITVKIHRGSLLRKMNARSLPELARMADSLAADFGVDKVR